MDLENYLKKDTETYNEKTVILKCFRSKFLKKNKTLIDNLKSMNIPDEIKKIYFVYFQNPDPFIKTHDYLSLLIFYYKNLLRTGTGYKYIIYQVLYRKTPIHTKIITTSLYYIESIGDNYYSKNKYFYMVSTLPIAEILEKEDKAIKTGNFGLFNKLKKLNEALEDFYN